MARIGIDVSQTLSPFETLPEENYRLRLVDYEITKSNEKQENMVLFKTEVVGGEFAGKTLTIPAMLEGKGKTSGMFTINQLCYAKGADATDPDLDELKGLEFDAEVTIKPRKDGKGDQNNVKILIEIPGNAG